MFITFEFNFLRVFFQQAIILDTFTLNRVKWACSDQLSTTVWTLVFYFSFSDVFRSFLFSFKGPQLTLGQVSQLVSQLICSSGKFCCRLPMSQNPPPFFCQSSEQKITLKINMKKKINLKIIFHVENKFVMFQSPLCSNRRQKGHFGAVIL